MVETHQTLSFLGDVVESIRTGRFVPATFQRQYVWTRQDVEELWASIAMNDPLGGLLMWVPEDEAVLLRHGRPRLGPVDMLEGRHVALILDGQNRLVSLAWSMVDPADAPQDAPGASVWKTVEDLVLVADAVSDSTPRVHFVRRNDVHGLMMPVWMLFDNHAFNQHLRTNWNGDAAGENAVDWLSRLQESARQARVVISTIQGGTAEQARSRFLRIARVGVPMSEADFDQIVKGE